MHAQICLALRHVHRRRILHRDLKSGNIFLTRSGVVKLGDFGIAKLLDSSGAQAATQIGTPYYLSPEICQDQPYGKASDLWSMGIVLYELLALRVPFQASNLAVLANKIVTVDPPPLSHAYSEECHNLAFSLLSKDPDKRPTINQVSANHARLFFASWKGKQSPTKALAYRLLLVDLSCSSSGATILGNTSVAFFRTRSKRETVELRNWHHHNPTAMGRRWSKNPFLE